VEEGAVGDTEQKAWYESWVKERREREASEAHEQIGISRGGRSASARGSLGFQSDEEEEEWNRRYNSQLVVPM
jgi:hypothetical protein